jgi:hypothetical protein
MLSRLPRRGSALRKLGIHAARGVPGYVPRSSRSWPCPQADSSRGTREVRQVLAYSDSKSQLRARPFLHDKHHVVIGLYLSPNRSASNVLVPPLHCSVRFRGLPEEALIGIAEHGRQFQRRARRPGW